MTCTATSEPITALVMLVADIEVPSLMATVNGHGTKRLRQDEHNQWEREEDQEQR